MIVGEQTRVRGTIECDEDLVVRGRVEGTVRVAGAITVEETGWVAAEVTAREVTVHGTVQGNVTASDWIEVSRAGRMLGDATAPAVHIVAGATFRGRVEMGDPAALAAAATAPELPPVERRALPRERQAALPSPARVTAASPSLPVPPPRVHSVAALPLAPPRDEHRAAPSAPSAHTPSAPARRGPEASGRATHRPPPRPADRSIPPLAQPRSGALRRR